MIERAVSALVAGEELSEELAEAAMTDIMEGRATPAQIGAFLAALAVRGETPAVVTGCARAMRRAAVPLTLRRRPVVDTCGTGGDHAGTFNISTAAALVVAGAGVPVAKHGNRAATSRAGSSDVLEALGIPVEAPPEAVAASIEEVGIGFLFAPVFHRSMRHAAGPRRELGIRTVFNLLGPLTNPAGAEYQLVGVARPEHLSLVAQALQRLGVRRALVVHGAGGVDEITPLGPAQAIEVREDALVPRVVDPGELGVPPCRLEDLAGGAPAENAALVRGVLQGERGPRRDAVLLNAAAALWVSGAAQDLRQGMEMARASVDEGRAWATLQRWQQVMARQVGSGGGVGA